MGVESSSDGQCSSATWNLCSCAGNLLAVENALNWIGRK